MTRSKKQGLDWAIVDSTGNCKRITCAGQTHTGPNQTFIGRCQSRIGHCQPHNGRRQPCIGHCQSHGGVKARAKSAGKLARLCSLLPCSSAPLPRYFPPTAPFCVTVGQIGNLSYSRPSAYPLLFAAAPLPEGCSFDKYFVLKYNLCLNQELVERQQVRLLAQDEEQRPLQCLYFKFLMPSKLGFFSPRFIWRATELFFSARGRAPSLVSCRERR